MFGDNQPVSPEEISEERKKEILSKLADGIAGRRLTAPAIMFLESIKPLNYISSQVMIFFEPVIMSIFSIAQYREIALILEERGAIEKLITMIEDCENKAKAEAKKDKQNKNNKDSKSQEE